MNPFAFFGHQMFAGLALLMALTSPAVSQDRLSRTRHCLSIADINERIDCLETGAAPNPDPSPAFPKQQSLTPSFDCRAARTSIERAICGDVTLSAWDSQMGQLFQQGLRLTKDRQSDERRPRSHSDEDKRNLEIWPNRQEPIQQSGLPGERNCNRLEDLRAPRESV
jgi:hypothetical protein